MTDRRAFVGMIAGGLLAVRQAAHAQPARKVYRIGILSLAPTSDLIGPQPRSPSIKALVRGMRDLGYTYGEHFVTEARRAEGKPERFPGMVDELVHLQVDVILAAGAALPALKQAPSTIPVIMTASNDPVAQGLVQSLGHPGGHFTGLSLQSVETTGKLLGLLKELIPDAAPVAVIWNKSGIANWRAAEAAARERVEAAVVSSAGGSLRRQDPEGRQPRRPTRRAANQVRAGDQSQDCEGTRPHDPPIVAAARG